MYIMTLYLFIFLICFRFHLEHSDLARIADCLEDSYADAQQFDYAPTDSAEAIDDYKRVLDVVGQLSGDFIPRPPDITISASVKINFPVCF